MGRKNKRDKDNSKSKKVTYDDIQPQIKKKFHEKDLIKIQPLTENQKLFFNLYDNTPKHLILTGSAGTGKSMCAIYKLLTDVLENKYDKLLIIRGACPINSVGFLPGSLEEKLEVFETPYMGIFDNLFEFSNAYKNLKEIGKVEFISTSYVRGQTFDNSAIFIDEIGGLTYHELFSVLTRIGENSRFVMAGDFAQNDLIYKRFLESGFPRLEKVIKQIPSIERIQFTRDDIVRSSFVKDLIIADEDTPDF